MTEAQKELHGLEGLLEAYKEHLRVLQVQYAKLGVQAPAHIVTEISRYEREVAKLTADLRMVPSAEEVAKLGDVGMYQLVYAHIMRLDGDLWRVSNALGRVEDKLDKLLMAFATKAIISAESEVNR